MKYIVFEAPQITQDDIDEVITTPSTFCATVNAAFHSGATPVHADLNLNTWKIDPDEIEKKITAKTNATIPVHYTSLMCTAS